MRRSHKDGMVNVFQGVGITLIAIFVAVCLFDAARLGYLTPGWWTEIVSFPEINWQQLTEKTQ